MMPASAQISQGGQSCRSAWGTRVRAPASVRKRTQTKALGAKFFWDVTAVFMWRLAWTCAKTATKPSLSRFLICQKRCVSSAYIDPSIREFTSALLSKQPAFQVQPSSVRILTDPVQFYDTLLVSFFSLLVDVITKCLRKWSIKPNDEYLSRHYTSVRKKRNW